MPAAPRPGAPGRAPRPRRLARPGSRRYARRVPEPESALPRREGSGPPAGRAPGRAGRRAGGRLHGGRYRPTREEPRQLEEPRAEAPAADAVGTQPARVGPTLDAQPRRAFTANDP